MGLDPGPFQRRACRVWRSRIALARVREKCPRTNFFSRLSKSRRLERHRKGGHAARHEPVKERTMKYMLLIYGNEANMLAASKETAGQMMAAYTAYTEAMKKAGVHVGSDRLRPTSSASTVRVANGKSQVLDGPYAETKE